MKASYLPQILSAVLTAIEHFHIHISVEVELILVKLLASRVSFVCQIFFHLIKDETSLAAYYRGKKCNKYDSKGEAKCRGGPLGDPSVGIYFLVLQQRSDRQLQIQVLS